MQLPLAHSKYAMSLCLSAILLMPTAALAALSSSDAARLDTYEKTVFGNVNHSKSQESRLRALEVNLFGKAHSGASSSRLDAIAKVVGGTSGSKFLPPLPAELDRSAFAPTEVKQAPSSAKGNWQDEDSSAAPSHSYDGASSTASGGSHDDVKDMLRDALAKHNQGDMNGAETMFRKVLSIDPHNSDAAFNLGAMAEDRNDLTGARHYYQIAANASPSDHDIADALASVNTKIKQQQQADQNAAAIAKQAQLKPLASDATAAYKAGKYDQAISDLSRIAAQTPNDANVQFGLAQAWRGKGDLNRAYQYLQSAISLAPSNSLYRATMTDLQADMRKGQQTASNPPSAPDYQGGGGSSSGYGGHHYRGGGGSQGGAEEGWQAADNSSAGNQQLADSSNGGVTPFTDQGSGQLYGHANAGGMGIGGYGGGLMGGMMGGMMGRSMSPYGRAYYGGSGSRLTRAMTGAALGAVVGGMTNRYGYGGFRAGAMRGALTGGLFSLMMGF